MGLAAHLCCRGGSRPHPVTLSTRYSQRTRARNLCIFFFILGRDGAGVRGCCGSAALQIKMALYYSRGVREVLDKFEGREFTCEYKYDGERAQIHVTDGGKSIKVRRGEPERPVLCALVFPFPAPAVCTAVAPALGSWRSVGLGLWVLQTAGGMNGGRAGRGVGARTPLEDTSFTTRHGMARLSVKAALVSPRCPRVLRALQTPTDCPRGGRCLQRRQSCCLAPLQARARAHVLTRSPNPPPCPQIYSRNLEDNTSKYPDVVSRMAGLLRPGTESLVLDCETVAWDRDKKQILPFQVREQALTFTFTLTFAFHSHFRLSVELCLCVLDVPGLLCAPAGQHPPPSHRRRTPLLSRKCPGLNFHFHFHSQVLSTRARKDVKEESVTVHVCLFAFDCLFLNGRALLTCPLSERRQALYSALEEKAGSGVLGRRHAGGGGGGGCTAPDAPSLDLTTPRQTRRMEGAVFFCHSSPAAPPFWLGWKRERERSRRDPFVFWRRRAC